MRQRSEALYRCTCGAEYVARLGSPCPFKRMVAGKHQTTIIRRPT